jgi:hypothetical protein
VRQLREQGTVSLHRQHFLQQVRRRRRHGKW